MPIQERAYWLHVLERLARPALDNLAQGMLGKTLPVEGARAKYAKLEITGRLLTGIAPWLECEAAGAEEAKRQELAGLARGALASGADPNSPDFFNFADGDQPLVDAAFLAQAILRAPYELWEKLEPRTQARLIEGFQRTRKIRPYYCNWLLFSAMIEAALYKIGADYDEVRVDYALRQHEQWYLGDGMYSDGPEFHWDYYVSYVILPMVLDITRVFSEVRSEYDRLLPIFVKRAQRQAVIQERLISPQGTFPAIGRSIAYRFGAFQVLAQVALWDQLPVELSAPQVRAALGAVIRRCMEAPGTFDQAGWLTVGLCGSQPQLGEPYISVASVYLCTVGLLPLGLPATHDFWRGARQSFTGEKVWSGSTEVIRDRALDGKRLVW